MKRVLALCISALLLLFPGKVFADEDWTIQSFHSDIAIQQTGSVNITESITVDFSVPKHGIYRDIPIVYEGNNQEKYYTKLIFHSVIRNGQKEPYKLITNEAQTQVKIGDANKTITGQQTYTLDYTMEGILLPYASYDELYWNVTGNNWGVPIQQATATVTLPRNTILQSTCYAGEPGSTQQCKNNLSESQKAVFSTNTLLPGEEMTVAVGFPKNTVPILTVAKPKTVWEELLSLPNILLFALTSLLGISIVLLKWKNHGRDYWMGNVPFIEKTALGTAKPWGAHETITVEFLPPEKLRPGEMGVLVDEKADTLDVTATIIDLATQGYLTIEEVAKKWRFGTTDYILHRTEKDTKTLLPYETELLTRLFASGNEVKLSDLKQEFYDDLATVKDKLYEDVVAKGLFPTDPETIRKRYVITALLLLTIPLGILFFVSSFFFSAPLIAILAGISLTGLILLLLARSMPRRTAYGHVLYRRSLGYRKFIDGAEAYRQKFYEKENLFNEILPYAIIFGLTEKFAKAMKELGIKPSQPSWYTGTTPFHSATFASNVNRFSTALSSAMVAMPGSSGSGGGGFSGGGFGGGGGGSW